MKSLLILSALSTAAIGGLAASPSVAATPALDAYGACAVKNYDGAELLATLPGSEEESEVLAAYRAKGCALPAAAPQLARGAVAEALFKADFGMIGARPKRNDEMAVFAVDVRQFADMDAQAKHRMMLVALGTCVADAAPDATNALLQAPAGSPAEAQAIASLTPGFSQCVGQGQTLRTGKQEVRAGLAEGAYRSALTAALASDVVVTGHRDPSAVVTCKNLESPGSRFRRQMCLTEAQWKAYEVKKEYAAREVQRRAQEYREMQDLCVLQARSGEGGGSLGNPEFAAGCL